MLNLSLFCLVAALAVVLADNDVLPRGIIHQIEEGVAGPNPYIFLTVPKGRSQSVIQGFEVIEENDDKRKKTPFNQDIDDEEEEEDDYEDDHENDNNDDNINQLNNDEAGLVNFNEQEEDDDDEADDFDNVMNVNLKLRKSGNEIKNAKSTQMLVSHQHAGAIMVPDEIIEIEGQSVIDEKTGKTALLLSRSVLDSIPDGSVVALMERPKSNEAEARANRVIVRRRRKGARRNLKRRVNGNRRYRVVRRGGNKRRNNLNRQNVIIVRRRNGRYGNGKKRRVNRRRIYVQA